MRASRIVVATDWSVMSRAAIAQARALAEWHDADLHVLQLGDGLPLRERRWSFSEEFGQAPELDTMSERVTLATRSGPPVEELVDYASTIGAELIVVGTSLPNAGMSQRESVGEAVARSARCATLVVPLASAPVLPDRPFRNVVCGVDFSPGSEGVLKNALDVAQGAEGALTVIHVLRDVDEVPVEAHRAPAEYRRLRESEATRRLWGQVPTDSLNWADVRVRLRVGDPAAHILAVSREVRADLIVIGTRPLSTLDRLLRRRSTTQHVTLDASCPVLVLRNASGSARWDVDFSHDMAAARESKPTPCVTAAPRPAA